MSIYRGTPYTVVYEAKNFLSGLINIVAMVRKPNGVVSGPFVLTEMPAPFTGRYSFDFLSNLTDPEGAYIVMISSASENIQITTKFELISKNAIILNPSDVNALVEAIRANTGAFESYDIEVSDPPVFEVELVSHEEENVEIIVDMEVSDLPIFNVEVEASLEDVIAGLEEEVKVDVELIN